MFQEVTIIFLSQNINLSSSYMQFCRGPKKKHCADVLKTGSSAIKNSNGID